MKLAVQRLHPTTLAVDTEGRLFLAGERGVLVSDGQTYAPITAADGIGSEHVRTVRADVASLIANAIRPDGAHAVTASAFANAIGLGLDEPPHTDVGATFEAGETYSLKIGVSASTGHHAIVSAMIAVRDDGNDVLWIDS